MLKSDLDLDIDSPFITRFVGIAKQARRINNLLANVSSPHAGAHLRSKVILDKKAAGFCMSLEELGARSYRLQPGRGKSGLGRGTVLNEAIQEIAECMAQAVRVVQDSRCTDSSAPCLSKEYAIFIFLRTFEALEEDLPENLRVKRLGWRP